MLGPIHVLLVLSVLPGLAADQLAPIAAPAAYLSASGTTAFGFGNPDVIASRAQPIPGAAFCAAFDVNASVRRLLDRMWRASPTFRRQCARLDEGGVRLSLSFDLSPRRVGPHAWTQISRKGGLHARIHMRGADSRAAEHIAHEVEHVLEQLDEVDLAGAATSRIRGATQTPTGAFETTRAIVVGRLVAAEVRGHQDGR